MSFLNDAQRKALESGNYICSKCGAKMEFEDKWEDSLVCPVCGHSIDRERYGAESDEEYYALYPSEAEICGYECENDTLDDIPDCCKACGGPYPQCTTSCKLFDD